MDAQKLRLLIRQVRDIQVQADKIIRGGENSPENIESFSRYSGELKQYIFQHVNAPEIQDLATQLTEIEYDRVEFHLWQIVLMPFMPIWWLSIYRDHQAKAKATQEIGELRGKYATLELLLKGLED
jgi:hypothetical protein